MTSPNDDGQARPAVTPPEPMGHRLVVEAEGEVIPGPAPEEPDGEPEPPPF
jgi:hypothetical protein